TTLKRASPQTLRRTSRNNVLTGMHLCNTNRPRTANSEQHKPKRMRARKNTSIILAREVTRRLFRSGRRWKRTSLQEESYQQPSTGRCEQSITFMLTEAH